MDQRSIFVMSLIRFEEINGNEFSFRPSEDELEQDIIHGIEVLFRQLGKISTSGTPFAGRRSQVSSDSNAAARRQILINNIASSDSRLVEKIVTRGS